MKPRVLFRVASAVLALTAVSVGLSATAGAAAPVRLPIESLHGEVSGERTYSDARCRKGQNHRQVMALRVDTASGPASLVVDTCQIHVGARAGVRIEGTFVLKTATGSVRGPANGTIGFTADDNVTATLQIKQRTGSLRWTRGTMELRAVVGVANDRGVASGTLGAPSV
jgi:hypothetical protein